MGHNRQQLPTIRYLDAEKDIYGFEMLRRPLSDSVRHWASPDLLHGVDDEISDESWNIRIWRSVQWQHRNQKPSCPISSEKERRVFVLGLG